MSFLSFVLLGKFALKLFSFDGKILDENKFYEFFGKDEINILNNLKDNNIFDNNNNNNNEKECWLMAISLAYFEIVIWKEFKEESIMFYHKSERSLKNMMMINGDDDDDMITSIHF